jgi:hypothetical protein
MKHTKQEKQLINEWLNKLVDYQSTTLNMVREDLKDFQKQHNLIDDELKVGKWYTDKENTILINITSFGYDGGVANGYGFTGNTWSTIINHQHHSKLELAPESYVIERFKWYAEQVMKYNHEKPNYKCLSVPNKTISFKDSVVYDLWGDGYFRVGDGYMNIIMQNGVWAETFEVEEKEFKSFTAAADYYNFINKDKNDENQTITIKIPKGVDYKIEVI